MPTTLLTFAATASESEGILEGLGIDFTLLAMQTVAFLITVFVLARWVYPVFLRVVDEREERMLESAKAAEKAQKAAESAEANVEAELKKARQEAADIVATAKAEAAQLSERSDKKAKERAERIVADAKSEIDKSIIAARKDLQRDTLELVKRAAAAATAHVADDKFDTALVQKTLKETSK